jgi:hypothetical protein
VAAFRLFSTVKHFGAAMSSRTIPPKLVVRRRQISTISSQSRVFRAMGMASTPAKVLKKTERTSSMARADSGPALPMPYTADPSLITATVFPRHVRSKDRMGVLAISRHGAATPGV